MGFFEDDRIRSKNRIINAALDIYDLMKATKTHEEMKTEVSNFLAKNDDPIRNNIYSKVLDIIKQRETYEGTTNK